MPTDGAGLAPRTAQVFRLFYEDPNRARYGYDLMKVTGMKSGTMYPILAFLESQGWIDGHLEDIDPVKAGRPRRRGFVLTPEGYLQARDRFQVRTDACPPQAPSTRPSHGGRA